MSDPGPAVAAPLDGDGRLLTGVPELDAMLSGGLLPGRPYLIVGPSGTGKTTLALQFLLEGVRRGERCLLITLEEPPNEIRLNHRALPSELERVFVFDAIPDVMRYERAPFKDIAAVRESVPFSAVPLEIRRTAELTSVEVTFTALEQTIKMEMARRGYSRLVVDSLTALQYFCMKGFDETLGAQAFLRFLSDLHVTTLLTVEAPLEDVESPERLLARGEIRLFRWERDGVTVRAIGVEKFRGSEHDIRLHPYRISPRGIDITLGETISRDSREPIPAAPVPAGAPAAGPGPAESPAGFAALEADALDLAAVGIPPVPVQEAVAAALAEARAGRTDAAAREIGRARGLVLALFQEYREGMGAHDVSAAARRLVERVASVRTGVPPAAMPPASDLVRALERLAGDLAQANVVPRAPAAEPPVPPPARAAPLPIQPRTGAGEPPSAPRPTGGPSSSSRTTPGPASAPPRPSAVPLPPAIDRPPLPTRLVGWEPPTGPTGAGAPEPTPPTTTAPAGPPAGTGRATPAKRPPLPAAVPRAPAPAAPGAAPAGPSVPPAPGAAKPARRPRKTAAAPRRRAAKSAPGPESVTVPSEPGGADAAASPPTPDAKPKRRRSPAKRKAPPVTGAAPGAPPPAATSPEPTPDGRATPDATPAASPPSPAASEPPEDGGSG